MDGKLIDYYFLSLSVMNKTDSKVNLFLEALVLK